MASQQEREELDRRASKGRDDHPLRNRWQEPRGTGTSRRRDIFLNSIGRIRGGETRKEQLGCEGYQEMGHKGGLSTGKESVHENAEQEGGETDESKSRTKS